MTQQKLSRNFAMVAEGTRRGSGDKRNMNIPETCGNMTISVSLEFLYRQRENMRKRNAKSMLLTVFSAVGGEIDPLKKRLIDYGLFGKQAQTNLKKFRDEAIEQFFVWGQNMSNYELRKIDLAFTSLCKAKGDESATVKNYTSSPKFNEAMESAKSISFLVIGRYDDAFVGVSETDDTKGFINLAYVKFATGKIPAIMPFDHPTKDGLVETEWNGKKVKDYVLDTEGSISLNVTRSYLKNFGDDGTHGWKNLKMFTKKDDASQTFWITQVGSYAIDELPAEFFASFNKETQEILHYATRVSFEVGLQERDGKLIDDILNVGDTVPDAILTFTGLITDDGERRMSVYTTEPDQNGEIRRYVTFKIIRPTFYTQTVL